jgi:hypothetical protein
MAGIPSKGQDKAVTRILSFLVEVSLLTLSLGSPVLQNMIYRHLDKLSLRRLENIVHAV